MNYNLNERKSKIVSKVIGIYLLVSVLLLLFVSVGVNEQWTIPLPHVHFPMLHIHFPILILTFLSVCLIRRKIRVDQVVFLMLLRCVLDFINCTLHANHGQNGMFGPFTDMTPSIVALFSYLLIIQTKINAKEYYKYVLTFGICIALQTLAAGFMSPYDYVSAYYKTTVNIPIASCNVISSFLVPVIVLPFLMDMKIGFKIFCSAVIAAAIVATKSRGGMIFAVIAMIIGVMSLIDTKNRKAKKLALFILIFGAVIYALSSPEVIQLLKAGSINLDSFSSGRLHIFKEDFFHALDRPLFGHGLYDQGFFNAGSHNILIELFYKSGIVGVIVYMCILIHLWKKIKDKYFRYYTVIFFLNSLFETCYFGYKMELVYWTIAGIGVAANSCNDRQAKKARSCNLCL